MDLIDQHNFPILGFTELVLGIHKDESPARGLTRSPIEQGESDAPDLRPKALLHDPAFQNLHFRDVLVVPLTRFGGRRENRFGNPIMFPKHVWQLYAAEFAARHLAGSLGIGLDGKFATWAGYVIDADSPILLVGSREQVEEAATRLGRIGLDRVVGYLDRDVSDISDLGSLQRFERYCPNTLRTALESGTGPKLLDVRTAGEFESGHVDGAVNIPLNRLEERLEEVPQGPLVVICRSGYRSILGASILQANGIDAVSDLEGGMLAWEGATCTASS